MKATLLPVEFPAESLRFKDMATGEFPNLVNRYRA